MNDISFSCKYNRIIIFDLIYVVITGIVLYFYPEIPPLIIVFNPVSFSFVLIIGMFIDWDKFTKYVKIVSPELWSQLDKSIYPVLIDAKWIFNRNDKAIPANVENEKLIMKKRIKLTYILFVTNIFIFILVIILLSFIIGWFMAA